MLALCSGGNFKTIKCVTIFVSSSLFFSDLFLFFYMLFFPPLLLFILFICLPLVQPIIMVNYIICDRSVQLEGGVTSVALRGDGHQFYVGTEAAQIYSLGYADFKPELIATNHNSAVKDVAFPLWVIQLQCFVRTSLLPPEGDVSFVSEACVKYIDHPSICANPLYHSQQWDVRALCHLFTEWYTSVAFWVLQGTSAYHSAQHNMQRSGLYARWQEHLQWSVSYRMTCLNGFRSIAFLCWCIFHLKPKYLVVF